MGRIVRIVAFSVSAFALSACATQRQEAVGADVATQQPARGIDALFDAYDQRQLEQSPRSKAYRGIRDEDYGEWGDVSDAGRIAQHELLQATAATMRWPGWTALRPSTPPRDHQNCHHARSGTRTPFLM